MKTFTINGKVYNAKPFDFNMICELEDRGISLEQAQQKPVSMVRAYFAICANSDNVYAGKEISEHIVNGGKLEDVMDIMATEMEVSDFFRSLSQNTETGTGKSKKTSK